MAKVPIKQPAAQDDALADAITAKPVATSTPTAMPALGASCTVKVAAGVVLMNNETGIHFVPEVATPMTCSVTLLRRIQDGDVTLLG